MVIFINMPVKWTGFMGGHWYDSANDLCFTPDKRRV